MHKLSFLMAALFASSFAHAREETVVTCPNEIYANVTSLEIHTTDYADDFQVVESVYDEAKGREVSRYSGAFTLTMLNAGAELPEADGFRRTFVRVSPENYELRYENGFTRGVITLRCVESF